MATDYTRRQFFNRCLGGAAGFVLVGTGAVTALDGAANKPADKSNSKKKKTTPNASPAGKTAASRPSAPALSIRPRSDWTTTTPDAQRAAAMGRIDRITIHHSAAASANVKTAKQAAAMLERIRADHLSRGWVDIGYHYVIDPSGRIWAARPATLQGAHVRGRNEHNLAIMLMGDFESEQPTRAALASLHALLRDRMHLHGVPAARVCTHRELAATLCPGRHLQSQVDAARAAGGGLA